MVWGHFLVYNVILELRAKMYYRDLLSQTDFSLNQKFKLILTRKLSLCNL